jgi:hypothetical protein
MDSTLPHQSNEVMFTTCEWFEGKLNLKKILFLNDFMLIINESLFDMVPMDVLHACQFLDIIHLCLKHDFWQVKTFIFSFLTKKI